MKPHRQLIKHDPDNGKWGDCLRTCVACLLDLHPGAVPHFCDDGAPAERVWAHVDEWLSERDLILATFAFQGDLEKVLECMEVWNANVYYILQGRSVKDIDHCVIAKGGQIIFDPAIGAEDRSAPLVGPCSEGFYWVSVITKLL